MAIFLLGAPIKIVANIPCIFFLSTLSHVKRIEGENLAMTEHQALHPNANDLENNFLKNNSRKKT